VAYESLTGSNRFSYFHVLRATTRRRRGDCEGTLSKKGGWLPNCDGEHPIFEYITWPQRDGSFGATGGQIWKASQVDLTVEPERIGLRGRLNEIPKRLWDPHPLCRQ